MGLFTSKKITEISPEEKTKVAGQRFEQVLIGGSSTFGMLVDALDAYAWAYGGSLDSIGYRTKITGALAVDLSLTLQFDAGEAPLDILLTRVGLTEADAATFPTPADELLKLSAFVLYALDGKTPSTESTYGFGVTILDETMYAARSFDTLFRQEVAVIDANGDITPLVTTT